MVGQVLYSSGASMNAKATMVSTVHQSAGVAQFTCYTRP